LVLRLVATVQTVLEKMQRHAETFKTKFVCQTKFTEAKEVFIEVFGKVTTDKLLASVVEGADAVCACVVAEGRSLRGVSDGNYVKLVCGYYSPASLPDVPSFSRVPHQALWSVFQRRP
jgi:hypothetical protein